MKEGKVHLDRGFGSHSPDVRKRCKKKCVFESDHCLQYFR